MMRVRWFLWMYVIPLSWMYCGGRRQRFADRCFWESYLVLERRAGRHV